jgi:hypothetical protein
VTRLSDRIRDVVKMLENAHICPRCGRRWWIDKKSKKCYGCVFKYGRVEPLDRDFVSEGVGCVPTT